MTNNFIPTLSRQPLYCVWIETGNPAHPLDCVWIDPELRSFVNVEIAASNDENKPEAPAEPLSKEGLCAGQLFMTQVRREEKRARECSAMNRLSWVVVVLWFLLSTAWADVAGRVSGMVSDPSGVFGAGATVTVNNTSNGTKQTTTPPTTRDNIRSRSFRLGGTNLRSIHRASSHLRRQEW
jgi:hypothetical protein